MLSQCTAFKTFLLRKKCSFPALAKEVQSQLTYTDVAMSVPTQSSRYSPNPLKKRVCCALHGSHHYHRLAY
jgi:hypothetical protein